MNMNTSLTVAGGKTLHALLSFLSGQPAPETPAVERHHRSAESHPCETIRGGDDGEGALSDLGLEREDHEVEDPAEAMCRLSLSREDSKANEPDSSMSWLSLTWDEPGSKRPSR